MLDSLAKLARLPAATRAYCGHEYTLSNIRFAEAVEPGNRELAQRKSRDAARRDRGEPTVPSTIAEELATNPFLRCGQPEVIAAAQRHAGRRLAGTVEVFAEIREWKNGFLIRAAAPADVAELLRLIHELAVYEKLRHMFVGTEAMLRTPSSARARCARRLMAERGGRAVGFALYLPELLHVPVQAGIYLEDVFVEPEHRGAGIGKALLQRLAALTLERGGGRFEWRVLDWNEPSIRFYESLGAAVMKEWLLVRLTGQPLERLAAR
jgi:GNAT superfamily N-acetyltransferase